MGGHRQGGSGGQQQQQRQGERDGGKEVVCSLPLPPRIITPPEGQGGLEGVLPREGRGRGTGGRRACRAARLRTFGSGGAGRGLGVAGSSEAADCLLGASGRRVEPSQCCSKDPQQRKRENNNKPDYFLRIFSPRMITVLHISAMYSVLIQVAFRYRTFPNSMHCSLDL